MPSSSRGESRAETQARRLELLVGSDPDAALRLALDIVARERAHRALETGGLLEGEEVKIALDVEAVKAAEIATVASGQSR